MNDKIFDSSVFVKDGRFTIAEIASIADALDFLDEWPTELQDILYQTTKRICHSAHDGRHPLDAARNAFAQWAKSANILEDIAPIPAWMTGPKSGPGGVLA